MQQTVQSITMSMMTLVRPFKGLKLIKFVPLQTDLVNWRNGKVGYNAIMHCACVKLIYFFYVKAEIKG